MVVNFFRNRAPAEETAAEIRALGRRALVVKANIGELDDLDSLFSAAVQAEFGGLDFLIHNAASGYNRPVLEQKAHGLGLDDEYQRPGTALRRPAGYCP